MSGPWHGAVVLSTLSFVFVLAQGSTPLKSQNEERLRSLVQTPRQLKRPDLVSTANANMASRNAASPPSTIGAVSLTWSGTEQVINLTHAGGWWQSGTMYDDWMEVGESDCIPKQWLQCSPQTTTRVFTCSVLFSLFGVEILPPSSLLCERESIDEL